MMLTCCTHCLHSQPLLSATVPKLTTTSAQQKRGKVPQKWLVHGVVSEDDTVTQPVLGRFASCAIVLMAEYRPQCCTHRLHMQPFAVCHCLMHVLVHTCRLHCMHTCSCGYLLASQLLAAQAPSHSRQQSSCHMQLCVYMVIHLNSKS